MANHHFYFASCVLMLLTLSWRTSTGLPVRTLRSETCPSLLKSLLLSIKKFHNNDVLCYGITSDEAVLRSTAETALSCTPSLNQTSGCNVQRNSSFSESRCLRDIMKDLAHYAAAFQSYINAPLRNPGEEVALLSPILGIIQNLRKNCSGMQNGEDSSEDVAQMWGTDTFINRLEMCKMMRGFYSRTITINRAMDYISSGDHRK